MRKLKLQVQISIDGFVGGLNGELDWMTWGWTDDIKTFVDDLTNTCDTILLGRKMTGGFVTHWEKAIENPGTEEYPFAKKMVDYPKYVFSKTLKESKWNNTILEHSTGIINELKEQDGKDIVVYGGADFVSNHVNEGLIDEYYLFINPVAVGNGLRIFGDKEQRFNLELIESRSFDCGIVLNKYKPKN